MMGEEARKLEFLKSSMKWKMLVVWVVHGRAVSHPASLDRQKLWFNVSGLHLHEAKCLKCGICEVVCERTVSIKNTS